MSMPIIVPSKTTRCQAITDMIASVALEQAALSHILNAEGEKLQKVIAMPSICSEQLLAVNKSVQATIESISKLEMILYDKLSLFETCLCDDCHKMCDKD